MLAASLVRSRATYFERLSSRTSIATTSSIAPQEDAEDRCGGGGGGGGGDQGRSDQDDDGPGGAEDSDDPDSLGTFFDKPSYTRYGAAVEMSQASFHGGGGGKGGGPAAATAAAGSTAAVAGAAAAAVVPAQCPAGSSAPAPCGGEAAAAVAPAAAAVGGLCSGSSGYVRSMSAHFARVSNGAVHYRGCSGGTAGMDGLFDDLVAHVGALLASHPSVETQMGMVQGLSDRLLQLHALCEVLGRKEDEVEHLRGVLRELTTTRAEAIRLKVQMAESLNGLQQEYCRVLRSAQLAQGTCKQHSARAAATRKQLLEVQGELLRYKRAVASLRDRNRRLRSENEDMSARLSVLEGTRLVFCPA
ncbi:hypothetical protein VOLCADRAFT_94991 [Volvox carteri f. nagariensis]|uniref:Uncharacterized protein n=1 Tax=Volvox carteri f. nagariensis TaxID=3068 RepID=D8U6B3_VOLCA|nr:uncharacterized protein VOLCADRAFT_94991 [Volvox carteri f. nagariensis]EFJ44684.1 hypothetical protein VOLCADRAFT_94991 [Volvox carteri f. nagariensis]|eukprot:XP_002954260.1 hypothetical protein VOLCADRAFT_94991 [Volvox carteri f. nagariensis]